MRLGLYLHLVRRQMAVVRNWPVYWLNRFGLTKGDVVYKLRNGMVVTSRKFSIDGGALNDVWFDESYEPNNFGIAFDWKACKTIVDIGANIGTFTTFAAYKSPHASIVSVEPEPDNLKMLERNVYANDLNDRVAVVPAAVGGNDGSVTLHITEKSSGGHSLFHHYGKTRDVEVAMTTLKTLFQKHAIRQVDFLKLDCEGGEYDGLYSLPEEDLAKIRFMAVEYHHFSKDPRHTPDQLRAYLAGKGFQIKPGKKSMFFAWRA